MLERDIERTVCRWVIDTYKASPLKLRIDGRDGFPDRTILFPDGDIMFLEFKSAGGSLRPQQERVIQILRDMGFRVDVVSSIDEGKAAVNDYRNGN